MRALDWLEQRENITYIFAPHALGTQPAMDSWWPEIGYRPTQAHH
jgi:hypothetical protein